MALLWRATLVVPLLLLLAMVVVTRAEVSAGTRDANDANPARRCCHVSAPLCRVENDTALPDGGVRILCNLAGSGNDDTASNATATTTTTTLDQLIWCPAHLRREDPCRLPPGKVAELHVTGGRIPTLNLSTLSPLVQLRVLNVSGSQVANISSSKDGCEVSSLEKLDLSGNRLNDIHQRVLTCNQRLRWINLIGNNWSCHLLEWFIDWVREATRNNLHVVDKQRMQCYSYVPSMQVTEFYTFWYMIDTCPGNCSCILRFKVMVVNCSGRNFNDFPDMVPNNTRNLIMQNNAIRNFHKLVGNDVYQSLTQLSVEDNLIESLAELENIYQVGNITTLNIAGNRLSRLPDQILEMVWPFQITFFKISRNPWACDCDSGKLLYEYLTGHFTRIQDAYDITCSPKDEHHPGTLVQHLSKEDFCVRPNKPHPLDYVNALLALGIVTGLSKLIYDWLYFRKTGKLPPGPKTYLVEKYHACKKRRYKYRFDADERSNVSDGIKA